MVLFLASARGASGAAMQRLLPLGAARRRYAHCNDAAVGNSDRRRPEWRLAGVLRS